MLQTRLVIPNTYKTGGFILTTAADTDQATTKVVVPEQTHIERVNLNEDVMRTAVEKEGFDTV